MPYPFWEPGVGYGVLMAVIAIVHVFVSHFAIGGGLYLVVAERAARKAKDEVRLDFVRKLSKFFILTTVVFGALTGVAIWFIIGLLNPKATEALIHNFVWGWATEWTFFVVEILAAILYWYGWKRLSAKAHMQLGWVYFIAAWLSLFVINGIITFMLTSGTWIETGNFWDGFFNPTFWPSLVFRTGICVAIAGLFALAVAARLKHGSSRTAIVRYNSVWALVGLVIVGAAWFWYRGAIPTETFDAATQRLSIPATALEYFQYTTYAMAAIVAVLGIVLARLWNLPAGIALLALGLVWFGAFEWFREGARKPYAIDRYMYGNGMFLDDEERFKDEGLLSQIRFRTQDDGRDLFAYACGTCHELRGYNPVLPAYDHTDELFVQGSILGLHEMRGKMPPFFGSVEEAQTLGTWLWAQADKTPLPAGAGLGEAVYAQRCERCHVLDGFNDKSKALSDYDADDLQALLEDGLEDDLEDSLDDGMPAFTGTEAEMQALLEHLAPRMKGGE